MAVRDGETNAMETLRSGAAHSAARSATVLWFGVCEDNDPAAAPHCWADFHHHARRPMAKGIFLKADA